MMKFITISFPVGLMLVSIVCGSPPSTEVAGFKPGDRITVVGETHEGRQGKVRSPAYSPEGLLRVTLDATSATEAVKYRKRPEHVQKVNKLVGPLRKKFKQVTKFEMCMLNCMKEKREEKDEMELKNICRKKCLMEHMQVISAMDGDDGSDSSEYEKESCSDGFVDGSQEGVKLACGEDYIVDASMSCPGRECTQDDRISCCVLRRGALVRFQFQSNWQTASGLWRQEKHADNRYKILDGPVKRDDQDPDRYYEVQRVDPKLSEAHLKPFLKERLQERDIRPVSDKLNDMSCSIDVKNRASTKRVELDLKKQNEMKGGSLASFLENLKDTDGQKVEACVLELDEHVREHVDEKVSSHIMPFIVDVFPLGHTVTMVLDCGTYDSKQICSIWTVGLLGDWATGIAQVGYTHAMTKVRHIFTDIFLSTIRKRGKTLRSKANFLSHSRMMPLFLEQRKALYEFARMAAANPPKFRKFFVLEGDGAHQCNSFGILLVSVTLSAMSYSSVKAATEDLKSGNLPTRLVCGTSWMGLPENCNIEDELKECSDDSDATNQNPAEDRCLCSDKTKTLKGNCHGDDQRICEKGDICVKERNLFKQTTSARCVVIFKVGSRLKPKKEIYQRDTLVATGLNVMTKDLYFKPSHHCKVEESREDGVWISIAGKANRFFMRKENMQYFYPDVEYLA